jgi:hypothetical protein
MPTRVSYAGRRERPERRERHRDRTCAAIFQRPLQAERAAAPTEPVIGKPTAPNASVVSSTSQR